MTRTRLISSCVLALVAAIQSPIGAQGSSQTVQLAFGYECGDRFLVRNDGQNPVVVEYAVAGSPDKSTLHLDGRQSAEIASAQEGNVELYFSGKVVASEPKGNRPCASKGTGVSVRPIEPSEPATEYPSDTEYAAPPVVVYAPRPYDYWYDYYDPYPFGYYGFSPFYYPSVGYYVRGGFGRGPIGRGAGGRGGFGGRGPGGRGGGHGGGRH